MRRRASSRKQLIETATAEIAHVSWKNSITVRFPRDCMHSGTIQKVKTSDEPHGISVTQ